MSYRGHLFGLRRLIVGVQVLFLVEHHKSQSENREHDGGCDLRQSPSISKQRHEVRILARFH